MLPKPFSRTLIPLTAITLSACNGMVILRAVDAGPESTEPDGGQLNTPVDAAPIDALVQLDAGPPDAAPVDAHLGDCVYYDLRGLNASSASLGLAGAVISGEPGDLSFEPRGIGVASGNPEVEPGEVLSIRWEHRAEQIVVDLDFDAAVRIVTDGQGRLYHMDPIVEIGPGQDIELHPYNGTVWLASIAYCSTIP